MNNSKKESKATCGILPFFISTRHGLFTIVNNCGEVVADLTNAPDHVKSSYVTGLSGAISGRTGFILDIYGNIHKSRKRYEELSTNPGNDLSGSDLNGIRFQNSKFVNVNFSHSDMRGVELYNSSFENCNFDGINFSYSHINASKFTNNTTFRAANMSRSYIHNTLSNSNHLECVFDKTDFSKTDFSNALFRAAVGRIDLSSVNFDETILHDTIFEDVYFGNYLSLERSSLDNVNFGTKLNALYLSYVSISNMNFTTSTADFIILYRPTIIKNVNFVSLALYEQNFSHSTLENVNFKVCVLDGCNFDYTNLRSVDFDGSSTYKVSFKGAALHGVTGVNLNSARGVTHNNDSHHVHDNYRLHNQHNENHNQKVSTLRKCSSGYCGSVKLHHNMNHLNHTKDHVNTGHNHRLHGHSNLYGMKNLHHNLHNNHFDAQHHDHSGIDRAHGNLHSMRAHGKFMNEPHHKNDRMHNDQNHKLYKKDDHNS